LERDWILNVVLVWGAIVTGASEELVFRGYAFRNVPERHPHLVILTSATCFALVHFVNLTHRSLFSVLATLPFHFVLGLALGIVRLASGSLAWGMLLHAMLDTSWAFAEGSGAYQMWFPLAFFVMIIASVSTLCLHPKLRNSSPPPATSLEVA
jgi:membrane protease YdiL (CAAX protease family)